MRANRPVAERFAEKWTPIVGPLDTPCHIWRSATDKDGYGIIWVDDTYRAYRATRWAYETEIGEIPSGMVLRHRCDTPSCVNVNHLEPGTSAENMRDMKDRGRDANRRGARHYAAKITEAQVAQIRSLAGMLSHQQIAEQFGVSRSHIGNIIQGRKWK